MGVVYSLPLCSRGDPNKDAEPEGDRNNNQPMPSLHRPQQAVIAEQPLSVTNLMDSKSPPTSLENPTAEMTEHPPPDATSTPKMDRERGDSSSLDSEGHHEGHVIDDEDYGLTTSDSGLEHSSSDELENLGQRPLSGAARLMREELERPGSAADGPLHDEGITEGDSEITLPMDNHETCEEDNDDDLGEDPVERPPEPTVPDERVDSSSSNESPTPDPYVRPPGPMRKSGADDTTSAISNLLSEIVGDRPHESHPPSFNQYNKAVAR